MFSPCTPFLQRSCVFKGCYCSWPPRVPLGFGGELTGNSGAAGERWSAAAVHRQSWLRQALWWNCSRSLSLSSSVTVLDLQFSMNQDSCAGDSHSIQDRWLLKEAGVDAGKVKLHSSVWTHIYQPTWFKIKKSYALFCFVFSWQQLNNLAKIDRHNFNKVCFSDNVTKTLKCWHLI